jgi:hypothetical protein
LPKPQFFLVNRVAHQFARAVSEKLLHCSIVRRIGQQMRNGLTIAALGNEHWVLWVQV